MVKKAKTPELPEEVKYYTCWKPFPNNADFEDSTDYIKFCRWIANILGESSMLYAVYYKPRVRTYRGASSEGFMETCLTLRMASRVGSFFQWTRHTLARNVYWESIATRSF